MLSTTPGITLSFSPDLRAPELKLEVEIQRRDFLSRVAVVLCLGFT